MRYNISNVLEILNKDYCLKYVVLKNEPVIKTYDNLIEISGLLKKY